MDMFHLTLEGQDCLCTVTHFRAGCPMRVTGSGFGDADPPEDDEIEFFLKDADGNLLEAYITPQNEAKVLAEFKKRRGLR